MSPRRSGRGSRGPAWAAAIAGLSLGASLSLGFLACSSPSATVDGGDLLNVYSKDAGADAPSDAKPPKDAGKKEPRNASVPSGPTKERKPGSGACLAKQGEADAELRRTLGRPACREEILESRDSAGSPRYACLMAKGAEARAPLPLIVLFHGPEGTPAQTDKRTHWKRLAAKFDMTGDPAHAGFIVLLPQGRLLRRDKSGPIFDSEHVGDGNVDVEIVDRWVAELSKKGLVDARRVYTVGESKGGQMAAMYAMLRADKVAAFAAFGSEAPRVSWTCADPPPPALLMYRACDAIAPCDAVEDWLHAREKAQAETVAIRLGEGNQEELHCALRNKCSKAKGTSNHERWPKGREEDILRFLAKHALSADAVAPPSTPDEPEPAPPAPTMTAP